MKKAITITTLIILSFTICSYAQSITDGWRLVKISQVYSRDNPNTSEYIYDDGGKLKAINHYYNNNYGNKWDSSSVKDFVYDKSGCMSGFTKYDVAGNLQYIMSYDIKHRIINKQIYKISANTKTPAKKLNQILKYSYKGNEVKESSIVPPSDKVVDETTYTLDERGNIIRLERKDMMTLKTNKYICGDYENKPNPNLFTGAYFYTAIQSKQNGKEGHWEDMQAPEKTESTYDVNGMVKKTIITEKDEKSSFTSAYTYSYAKMKLPAKPAVK